MELINGRFRLIKILKHSSAITTYLAEDILKTDKVFLNIVRLEYLPKNFSITETYRNKYINIRSGNISEILEMNPVKSIDNRKMDNLTYFFYITEYIEELDEYEFKSYKEMKNATIDICKGISYLHLRGIKYKYLNPNNIIMFLDKNGELRCKLRDILTCEINDNSLVPSEKNFIKFKSPEMINNKTIYKSSDIYSLGVLLKDLFLFKAQNQKSLNELKDDSGVKIKINMLIRKMIHKNPDKRYDSIKNLVQEINDVFGLEENFYELDDIEKLNLKPSMYGVDKDMSRVIQWCENMDNGSGMVFVHGSNGLGKTSFLKNLEWKLEYKYNNVFSSYKLEKDSKNIYKPFTEMFKKLIHESKKNLIREYGEEIRLLTANSNDEFDLNGIENQNPSERYKFNSRLLNFLCDSLKNEKNVIFIDNIQNASEHFLEFMEMILSKNTIDRNILLIVSYSDEEIWMNDAATRFVKKFRKVDKNIEIQMKPLDRENCTLLIKDVLNMSYLPVNFASRIYNHTYGNPVFVYEVLKDLFAKKAIYITPETGLWTSKISSYEKLRLPENIVSASQSQIDELDESIYDGLKRLAVFQGAIDISVLKECQENTEKYIDYVIRELCNKGILINSTQGLQEEYIFTNKMMKRVIYEKIAPHEKKEFNLCIARIIEGRYKNNKTLKYLIDMINYYEEAQEYEKVVYYCLKSTEKNVNNDSWVGAVELLEKALKYCNRESIEGINIRLKLASLNLRFGDNDRAIEYLNEGNSIAKENNHIEKRFDILYELLGIFILKNEKEHYEFYMREMKDLYERTGNLRGRVQYLIRLIRIQISRDNNISEAMKTIDLAKSLSLKNEDILMGELYNAEGICNNYLSEKNESVKSFKMAIKFFEKGKYTKGVINALNNIAVTYYEHFKDNTKALEMFEKSKDVAEENKINEILPLIYSNLAEINTDVNNLSKGEEYLEKCIKLTKNNENFENKLFENTKIVLLNLQYANIDKVEKAFSECKKLIYKKDDRGRTLGEFFLAGAERAMLYGNFEEALEYCDKAEKVYEKEENKLNRRVEFIKTLIRISNGDTKIVEETICQIEKIEMTNEKINMIFDLLIVYKIYSKEEFHGIKNRIMDILSGISEENNICSRVKVEISKCIVDEKREITKLELLIEQLKGSKMELFILYGNYIIAKKYYGDKDYIHSLDHYLRVIELFNRIFSKIPDDYKESFSGRSTTRFVMNKIQELEVYFTRKRKIYEDKGGIVENLNELLTFDFYRRITNSKSFGEYTKKLYKHKELYYIEGLDDIMNNLYSDPEENLKFICNYIENITLAERCMIMKNDRAELKVLYSSNGDYSKPKGNIIERVKITSENILYNKVEHNDELKEYSSDAKGIICIPIVEGKNSDIIKINDRRTVNRNQRINGILYIETHNILNNFNRKSKETCEKTMSLLNTMLVGYDFKMISAVDKLTNVFTRKYLMDALDHELEKAYETGSEIGIMIVDLDHFKNINDKYGHQKGDEVLAKTCEIMKSVLRSNDIVGRYGGEEFLVVLPDTGLSYAVEIGERIRKAIKKANILGENHPVSASIGVSAYPEHSQLQEELIEKADKALYDAKEEGRDRVKRYTPLMEFQNKSANKLSGIITGNAVADSRNVLTLIQILDLVEEEICFKKKIYNLLGRIIESTESLDGILFKIEDDRVTEIFARQRYYEEWVENINFNSEIIKDVIGRKEGVFTIDWNVRRKNDEISELPDWNSMICVPVKDKESVKAILMLRVPTAEKEFNYENLNFVNTIMRLAKDIILKE